MPRRTKLDLRLPLVADRSGEMINVSFQALDEAARSVTFYAPVLERMEYRQAAPIGDYRAAFAGRVNSLGISPAFSCNCILNYLYGNLEGKQESQSAAQRPSARSPMSCSTRRWFI